MAVISATLRLRTDMTLDGVLVPAGEYEGVHIAPRKDVNASGGMTSASWRLLSKFGAFDVGPQVKAGEIIVEMD